jgi:hypothetical protein
MGQPLVVHAVAQDALDGEEVARRLKAAGVSIVDQQRRMMLVEGAESEIARALGGAHGWAVAPTVTTPPPSTRVKIQRRP